MKRNIDCSVRLMIVAGLFEGMLICASAQSVPIADPRHAQSSSEVPGLKEQTGRLHDMVRAEAELAWQQLQHQSPTRTPVLTGAAAPPKRHEIRSIYGLGNRLYAEVVLDAQSYLFVSGRSQALQGPDRQWILQRIQPPCVHLKREDLAHVFCLGATIE